MAVPVYFDPLVLTHDTGPDHPETATRVAACVEALRGSGAPVESPPNPARTRDAIGHVHPKPYVDRFFRASLLSPSESRGRSLGVFDSEDNPISRRTYEAAVRTVGLGLAAVDTVLSGNAPAVFVAVRPPGHHAMASQAMGFCFFNTIAVLARDLVATRGLASVLIADFDVHHGNGTQEIFWEDGRVGYLSVHRFPFYPGTGWEEETGSAEGLGATVNVPVPGGAPERQYVDGFKAGLETLARRLKPEMILVSAGFDAHERDPLGGMRVTSEGYAEMTRAMRGVAEHYAAGRMVSLLEGGYDPAALGESAAAHVGELAAPAT